MRMGDSRLFPTCRKCGRPAPLGKKVCARCLVTKSYKVTILKSSSRGANKRGTCLHKPDKPRTRKAKGQKTGGPPPGFRDPFLKPKV